jgi:hypothetical protein
MPSDKNFAIVSTAENKNMPKAIKQIPMKLSERIFRAPILLYGMQAIARITKRRAT